MKKILWISSYLPRPCGIAYYSTDYIEALKDYAKKIKKDISIKIISHTDAFRADFPIIDLKDREWNIKVFNLIKKQKPNLVHIQHEYGLYETYGDRNQRVIDLIKMIKSEKIPVIMTYHSIYKKLERDFARFTSETLKELSAGIVHEKYQKDFLKNNIKWEPQNVYVLPHGSKPGLKINKATLKEKFGYENKLVVGTAGIADERKGFRTLIKQWPKVVEKIPNALLVLEIKPHKVEETKEYIGKVLQEVMKSPYADKINFSVKNYSVQGFYDRLGSFDVLVLAYKSESQSGVLAHGFATGTPAIVTDIEGLGAEIRNSKAGFAVKNRADFYKYIIKVLSSKRLRNTFSKNALKYVKNVNGWDIIAKKTFKIYSIFW